MKRAYNAKLTAQQNAALDRRYKAVQMQRFMLGLVIIIVISCIVFLSSTIKAFAGSSVEELPKHKYYKSITVEKGDTLWDLASSNIDGADVDMSDYMNEVRRMNNLYCDEIHAGQTLIIAYYSSDIQ